MRRERLRVSSIIGRRRGLVSVRIVGCPDGAGQLSRHSSPSTGFTDNRRGADFEGRISSEREGTVVTIGRNTFVGGSHIVCAEKITIGDDVLISWGCTIVDHNSHALSWVDRADDVKEYYYGRKNWNKVKISPVTICDRVWIGFNSIVLCGVTVGEGAVVGCGSIVTKDVLPYSVVAGCPARIIREAGDVV